MCESSPCTLMSDTNADGVFRGGCSGHVQGSRRTGSVVRVLLRFERHSLANTCARAHGLQEFPATVQYAASGDAWVIAVLPRKVLHARVPSRVGRSLRSGVVLSRYCIHAMSEPSDCAHRCGDITRVAVGCCGGICARPAKPAVWVGSAACATAVCACGLRG